ncbi:TPA: IS200/IS605 family transposase [Candidatus Uhrbacteria bacterium]|nr:IS200/IS605 family transposase [Candidatus Uhrbacteria bacterium]
MNQYRKLFHTVYDCRYHVVFVPKYRFRILEGEIASCIQEKFRQICEWKEVNLIEGKVRTDHVHLYLSVPPKYSISDVLKWLKGDSSVQVFRRFPEIKKRYWGQHFWARGYFVSTVGITDEIIRAYIKHQEQQELLEEELDKQQRLWK